MLLMKESALTFEEKQHNLGLNTFKLPASTNHSININPLNNMFDDFSIWLLGYRTEFSCLYIPQGHNFISTVWLWSTNDYVVGVVVS